MSNEALWSGTFGDEYVVRNDGDFSPRGRFFQMLFKERPIASVLEVGCNNGMNLDLIPCAARWGCDVNGKALALLHARHADINAVRCSGFDLPFRGNYFDCVMTCGVLIHQKPAEVDVMMQEIIRVSGEYVLCMEYDSPTFEPIPYRGNDGSLFKGPFGLIYMTRYGLRLVETGFLSKQDGFDRVTYHMLSKV